MTINLEPLSITIDKLEHSFLVKDAATLRMIESCVDYGMDDEELGKRVKRIINDTRKK